MAYHSSSLLPGATNYVRNEADRTAFLNKINDFIGFFLQDCGGYTASISDIAQSLRDNEANPE